MPTKQCECSDPGCPVKHTDNRRNQCSRRGVTKVRRIDMEDGQTRFTMCEDCAADALSSGVFA